MHRRQRLKSIFGNPVLLIAGCQSVAALAALLLLPHIQPVSPPLTPWIALIVQGIAAALLGLTLNLSRWWAPFQVALPSAVVLALSLNVPGWIWPALFAVSLLVFWNAAKARVPLYLSNRTTWAGLRQLLPQERAFSFIDLGCGLGGTTQYLARHLPEGRFLGVETAPLPFAASKLRQMISGLENASIAYASMWDQDLSGTDVVYAFLSPAPMPELYAKAKAEMRPGSMFISNSFQVPGHPADEIVELDDARRTQLHIWRF